MLKKSMKKDTISKVNPKLTVKQKQNVDEEDVNIFNLGTLVQLETHSWQGFKKIKDSSILDRDIKIQNKERIKHSKDLIDRAFLKDINSAITEARTAVKKYAFPFPLSGIDFIAKDKVKDLNEELLEIRVKFKKAVKAFAKKYDECVEASEKELGDLWNVEDYPDDIQSKFDLSWRFFDMSLPKKVGNELYEEESKKFKNLMEETKRMGIVALREGFGKIVNNLVETLSGKLDGEEKRIRQDSIDKISDFFEEFQSKNIFKDEELEELVKKAKNVVKGVSSKHLKDDNSLAEAIHKQLSKVSKELNKSTETFRRKLTL